MPARRLIAISMAVVLALPALAAGAKGSCGTTPGCCCARVARAPAPTSRGCCEMAPGAKPESLGQVSSHQARRSRPDAPSHLSVAPSRQNAPKHGGFQSRRQSAAATSESPPSLSALHCVYLI